MNGYAIRATSMRSLISRRTSPRETRVVISHRSVRFPLAPQERPTKGAAPPTRQSTQRRIQASGEREIAT